MEPVDHGAFVPNDEVDEVRWIPVREAAKMLSYDGDRTFLAAFD
jgi:8-oxo-dGTP diphosphatase